MPASLLFEGRGELDKLLVLPRHVPLVMLCSSLGHLFQILVLLSDTLELILGHFELVAQYPDLLLAALDEGGLLVGEVDEVGFEVLLGRVQRCVNLELPSELTLESCQLILLLSAFLTSIVLVLTASRVLGCRIGDLLLLLLLPLFLLLFEVPHFTLQGTALVLARPLPILCPPERGSEGAQLLVEPIELPLLCRCSLSKVPPALFFELLDLPLGLLERDLEVGTLVVAVAKGLLLRFQLVLEL